MTPAIPRLGEFRAYAHRGGAAENPENSPAAFAHAVGLGFQHLETDVRPTRDGVAVLHHDARLDRTTDSTGLVRRRSWREIRAVRLADGAPPWRLEDLLEAFPGVNVNVDVKEAGSVPAVFAAIERCRAWDRVCITSFSRRRTGRVRRLAGPGVATSAHPTEVFGHHTGLGRLTPPTRLQVPPVALGRKLVDTRFVRSAHARGLAVDVWTVDDRPEMERLLDLGVDGIMTDQPTLLRDVLLERDLWPGPQDSNICS